MSAAAGAASGSSAMERPGRAARRPGSGKPGRERSRDRPFFFKTAFRNTIYHMLRERPGWRVTDSDMDWDLHWAERDWMFEVFDTIHLSAWQRVNHFRNDRELCRKDLLIKNVKRHRRDLEKMGRREEAALFDFCPKTFVLPVDYALFEEAFKKSAGMTWIMKPTGRSQGKGIFLFRNLKDITRWKNANRWKSADPTSKDNQVENYVVQRYIANPFLVGGRKFDLRLYALVTSYTPLTCYIYRAGFARFTNVRYSSNPSDMDNSNMHLTNVAIQKKSEGYDAETGSKWDVRLLKLYLVSRYGIETADRVFHEVQEIMIRALLCVQPVMINDKHCFELYGYDIMFDDTLKPWLLEVNASPSLSANTPADFMLKYRMLSEVMDVVDFEGRRRGDEMHVGGFDLVHNGKPVRAPKASRFRSFIGAELPPPAPYAIPKNMRPEARGGAMDYSKLLGTGRGARGAMPTPSAAARADDTASSGTDTDTESGTDDTTAASDDVSEGTQRGGASRLAAISGGSAGPKSRVWAGRRERAAAAERDDDTHAGSASMPPLPRARGSGRAGSAAPPPAPAAGPVAPHRGGRRHHRSLSRERTPPPAAR